jgi:8-amino-7-oxononanoate synthase
VVDRKRHSGLAGDSQIIPVVLGDNARALTVAATLQAAGFDVRAIRPPTVPPGTARLRIAGNLKLDETTLRRFVASLAAAMAETKICSMASL